MQANSKVISQSEEMEFICHLLFLENSEPATMIVTYIYNHVLYITCKSAQALITAIACNKSFPHQPDLLLLIIKVYTK